MSRNRRAILSVPVVTVLSLCLDLVAPPILPEWIWYGVVVIAGLVMLVGLLLWIEQPWRNTKSFEDRQRLREANWRAGDRRR